MTIQVSTTDQRTAKALELLATAPTWLKITSKLDGKRYYAVPSSDGQHVYWVRPDSCTCPDAAHRAVTCKHMLAAALWVAKVNAERQQSKARAPKPAAPSDTFTTALSATGSISSSLDRARMKANAALYHDIMGRDDD